jgi:hypothetical protein
LSLIDAGFDSDASATNLLSDASSYSLYRQIGWVLNDGAGAIVKFKAYPDGGVVWDTAKNDRALSATGLTSGVLQRVSAPPGSLADVTIFHYLAASSSYSYMFFSDPDLTDNIPDQYNARIRIYSGGSENTGESIYAPAKTNASSAVRLRVSHASHQVAVQTFGFKYLWD